MTPAEHDNRMDSEEEAYHSLCAYTLTHGDAAFIHQHVVDARAVQHANERSKPIGVTFALIGLYLHVEKGYTGREVQRAHMALGQNRRQWPTFALPADRGAMTARDVMAAAEGAERDAAIHAWCASIWKACNESRDQVTRLLREHRIT
jgi:hypothetical protein